MVVIGMNTVGYDSVCDKILTMALSVLGMAHLS